MDQNSVIEELTTEQCWELLEKHAIGRLAYHLSGEVHIVPINYVVSERQSLIFRTAPGNKLLGLHMDCDVAFEIDETSEADGASVVARGYAEQVPMSQDIIAEDLGLKPWVPTEKFNVIRIQVTELTGRRFRFEK